MRIYIDLLYVDYELIKLHLVRLDYNEFEFYELLDAAHWLGNINFDTESKKEAFDFLLTLTREKTNDHAS